MSVTELEILKKRFMAMRKLSEKIVEPLEKEDYVVQAVEDVSPPKWHLAHTTWFFEEFILKQWIEGYEYYLKDARKLFNSYYETISRPFPRSVRGLITRPTVDEIKTYRWQVDKNMEKLLDSSAPDKELVHLMELGIQHEQQHQELLIADTKFNLSINPSEPVYSSEFQDGPITAVPQKMNWLSFDEGVITVGTNEEYFSFDNEQPEHRHYVYSYKIADRPVSNREFIQFINDGGYETPDYWLSDGWAAVKQENWKSPLYWEKSGGKWTHFSLTGRKNINLDAPVQHVSYFEADAYARWAGFRLPTEFEWENALKEDVSDGCCLEQTIGLKNSQLSNLHTGYVWEWTASPYVAYPQAARPEGALGEYNMKFMNSQMVLRGGSAYTPKTHIRGTYRNFFPPEKRWQCMGIRLAANV
jgi:ergothioneine biosynthesis protein EgtB